MDAAGAVFASCSPASGGHVPVCGEGTGGRVYHLTSPSLRLFRCVTRTRRMPSAMTRPSGCRLFCRWSRLRAHRPPRAWGPFHRPRLPCGLVCMESPEEVDESRQPD
ncbi:unnamed protein product [Protopolystoma xenopodis]|uniref:Uncharacterized protein n=1 Tax=Protopolystoma xenopodis TaxID=117903 RepID=A0A3S5AHY7_9PLAT|nr:unnamed protein product [Protopolystoma xenopodis]